MFRKRTSGFIVMAVVLVLLSSVIILSVSAVGLPQEADPESNILPFQGQMADPIVIDHTTTDISQIPDYWLEQARALAIHYAHTSHGSQLMAYLPVLESADPDFAYTRFYAGSSPPGSLAACDPGTLCIYDGNPPETYITPDDYWEGVSGLNRTRAVADTSLFDYSMWSWCGQASYYSTAQIQAYLDSMLQFESEYPGMRFILMTGHTDGGTNQVLIDNNNLIRQFAQDHGMVLFDFADIESYDPDGNYYPNTTDNCSWCSDWCAAHPEDCQDLTSCAHSHGFNCKLKSGAFWWMMARLAGWSGPGVEAGISKTVSAISPGTGQQITYTIAIHDLLTTAHMIDTIPPGLAYIPGTLQASSGACDAGSMPTLAWSGDLSAVSAVTITYVVTVEAASSQAIHNTAVVTPTGGTPISATASIVVNGTPLYLPGIFKAVP